MERQSNARGKSGIVAHTCNPELGRQRGGHAKEKRSMGEHPGLGAAVLVGKQDSKVSCVTFGPPVPNMAQSSLLQWLLLFNFPRPSRSRSGCTLSAWGARSQRLCSASGLHVHVKASPLSSHCASCPCGRHLFADGTCGPSMPPLHPSQVNEPRGLCSLWKWCSGDYGQKQ